MSRYELTAPRQPVDPQAKSNVTACAITNTSGNYRWNATASIPSNRRFTISFWFKNRNQGAARNILTSNNGRFAIATLADGRMRLTGFDTTPAVVVRNETAVSSIPNDSWAHFLLSHDQFLGVGTSYVNDVSSVGASKTIGSGNVIDTSDTTWLFANSANNDWDIAEFVMIPGLYLDFSVEENRRKFITASGAPVNLGDEGQFISTIVQPYVYLSGAGASFFTNLGTGPDFTNNSMSPAPGTATSNP